MTFIPVCPSVWLMAVLFHFLCACCVGIASTTASTGACTGSLLKMCVWDGGSDSSMAR